MGGRDGQRQTERTRRTPHSGSSPRAGVSQEISLALLDNDKENDGGATHPFPALHTAILYSQQNITTFTLHREMFIYLPQNRDQGSDEAKLEPQASMCNLHRTTIQVV